MCKQEVEITMLCQNESCKYKENRNIDAVCNIAINIPVTYGSATTFRRDGPFSHELENPLVSENIPGLYLNKKFYDLPKCRFVRKQRNNKGTDSESTFKSYDTIDLNEDIEEENFRCICTANETLNTSFIKIPIDLETAAACLEGYSNYGEPELLNESWYYQFINLNDIIGESSKYSKDIRFYKKRHKEKERNRNVKGNDDIIDTDDENCQCYEYYSNFFRENDENIATDEEEQIQPSFIVKSLKQEPRKQDESMEFQTYIDEERLPIIKCEKISIPPNLAKPIILTFGGMCNEQPISEIPNTGKLIYAFDPVYNQWQYYGEMPVSRSYHTAVLVNDEIYIIGGYDHNATGSKMTPTNDVVSYNITKREWYRRAKMLFSRASHSSVVYKGIIYALGGVNQENKILKSVEKYDLHYNKWIGIQEMLYPVTGAASCIIPGYICVIGGMTGDGHYVSSILIYNLNKESWQFYKHPLPSPLAYGKCSLASNTVTVIGGESKQNSTTYPGSVFMFDSNTKKWIEFTELSMCRKDFACASIESSTFIIGGLNISEEGESSDVVNGMLGIDMPMKIRLHPLPVALTGTAAITLYPTDNPPRSKRKKFDNKIKDVFLYEWRKQRLEQPIMKNAAEMKIGETLQMIDGKQIDISRSDLPNPIILTFGGITAQARKNQIQKIGTVIFGYDPVINRWKHYGEMPVSRSYHTAVLVDDEIYIIGGKDHMLDPTRATDEVVSYNVNARKWYRRSRMIFQRSSHCSVVYKGVIYTLGGMDQDKKILGSIEKYDPQNKNWIELQEMIYPVAGAASCVSKGHIFVIGGMTEDDKKHYISSIMHYNIENDSWLTFDFPLPYPLAYGSCPQSHNMISVIGGEILQNNKQSSGNVLIFDDRKKDWFGFNKSSVPRKSHACVSIEFSTFIIGGSNIPDKISLDIVEGMRDNDMPTKISLQPLPFPLTALAAITLFPTINPTSVQLHMFDDKIKSTFDFLWNLNQQERSE